MYMYMLGNPSTYKSSAVLYSCLGVTAPSTVLLITLCVYNLQVQMLVKLLE